MLQTTIFGTPGSPDAVHLTSIRNLGSIDILDPITETELPNAIIEDQIYLDAAEMAVLSDTKLTKAQADVATGETKTALQNLLIIKTVLLMLPQFIQITSQKVLSRDTDYQEMDWQEKEEQLLSRYNTTILIINPATPTTQGTIGINVRGTSSRVNR